MYLVWYIVINGVFSDPMYIAPDDYDGGTLTCTIQRNETKTTCPPLRTHLNRPLEDDEHFKAVLSLQDGPDYAEVGPDPAFVTIIDKTGKNAGGDWETQVHVNYIPSTFYCIYVCPHYIKAVAYIQYCIVRTYTIIYKIECQH